ncbi:DNA repair protein RecO [Patescibacteria group bacterium]|nr:DNA repair protein RecO [Patescibacteria group bacterium]
MSLTKTKGVIIRATNLREADRILEIYSDDLGKIRAVARGVRKIQSKLAGHLEPFTYVDLMLAKGRGDLPTITGAKALLHFSGIRKDVERMASASYLAELVSRLNPDEQASKRFPIILRDSFEALDTGHEPAQVVAYYEWNAVTAAGWQPELQHCVNCYQKLYPQGLSFSLAAGGVLCKNCIELDTEAITVSPEAIKLLRCYSTLSFEEVEGVMVGKDVRKETNQLVDHIVKYTLDRAPRSKAFLTHLEAM